MSHVRVTEHAVEQFISRHHRDMTARDARAELERMVTTAVRLKTRTLPGDEIWLEDEVEMVVRWDGRLRAHIVVTVLPAGSYQAEIRHTTSELEEIQREAEIEREEHRKKIAAERAATRASELARAKTDPRLAAEIAHRDRVENERLELARATLRERYSGKVSRSAVRAAERVFQELGLPMPSVTTDDGG